MIEDESDTIGAMVRDLAPSVVAILARQTGQFDAAEDAVQEALLEASRQWRNGQIPDHPRAWLVTVARRRMQDQWRSDQARRRREVAVAPPERVEPDLDSDRPADTDDTLALFVMCCHPALSPTSQVALTLRAVGGLTTAQIAAAYLVPEATMAQRISRAKQAIRKAGAHFELPPAPELDDRLQTVMRVLYLIFNEGYTASGGGEVLRSDLTGEAIRLGRLLHRLRPDDGETSGLLALMLLTDARRPARLDAAGELVPLDEQDRSVWDGPMIEEGLPLIGEALQAAPLGPYQVQAAIAAVHAEAPTAAETDWAQIAALYGVLANLAPSPIVELNRAAAIGMAESPQAGLDLLAEVDISSLGAHAYRLEVVRGGLLKRAGNVEAAREAFALATERTTSEPERRYLARQAAALDHPQN